MNGRSTVSTLLFSALLFVVMLIWQGPAKAAPEWIQVGRISGDAVCGDLETGLGDTRQLRFHPYSRFLRGNEVEDRIRIQRGSRIAVRLIGHGADVLPSLREEIRGVTATVGAQGRYINQPNASGPIGFVEVRIDVRANAELGRNSVYVQWPLGEARIPLVVVAECEQTRPAPSLTVEDSRCFGAVGKGCGVPVGGINPLATCAKGLCLYNGGSLTHDACCAANPAGHACGGPATFSSGENICRAEMDRAVSRAASGFNWHRETDYNKVNRDGKLVAADVCAPTGTIVHRADENFCCSRMGVKRLPTLAERSQSEMNPMVKGYATPGPARNAIAPDAVACD